MNHHRSPAIGTSEATIVPPTMPIGRSRSVSSSTSPPERAAEAAMAERMPPTIGPMILSRVQTAATPIVPAPMKRTWLRNTVFDRRRDVRADALNRGQHRDQHPPGDQHADQHGDADGHADQMADADQRHRQARRCAARRAATEAEGGRQLAGGELHRRQQREAGRGNRAGDDGGQAFGVLLERRRSSRNRP